MNHSRWNLLPPAAETGLGDALGVPPLVAQLLHNRGLSEPSQVEAFLAIDKSLVGDPFLLPDMHQAVARIYRALLSGEIIAIYGDFDVDGITATALLVQGLSLLGGNVVPYIPHRINEGHGLKTSALENLRKEGTSLVISVDCGITGYKPVKKAQRMGLDVIVTDHHTPVAQIPPAVAVIDPKLPGSEYPFIQLAGVGVAFKLLQALLQSMGKEKQLNAFLDLVALGTISDMMPLLGENRYLVKYGLKMLNTTPRLGIQEMMAQTGVERGSLDSQSVNWVLSPRLNAAGRLAHAMTSYHLLMTDSQQEACELSLLLEQTNIERQKLTADALAKAKEQILAKGITTLLVVCGDEYPAGISGLVAGRLCDEFYRPAIVVKVDSKVSTASCRSIPDFNIIAALNQYSDLMLQFGGHPQAAGFTLPTKYLPRLLDGVSELADVQLEGFDLRRRVDIDAEIILAQLTGSTYRSIQQLAPFGYGNPMPTFLSRSVEVLDCQAMGNNGDHLRLRLRQGSTVWNCVAFRQGDCLPEVSPFLDIVYNLEADRWRGEDRLRLNILDFAPAV
ncbi:single-stranded-DNA-specific exonuclease RecJ [Chloroflexota bacterium]